MTKVCRRVPKPEEVIRRLWLGSGQTLVRLWLDFDQTSRSNLLPQEAGPISSLMEAADPCTSAAARRDQRRRTAAVERQKRCDADALKRRRTNAMAWAYRRYDRRTQGWQDRVSDPIGQLLPASE